MTLYYVETGRGCGIRSGRNMKEVEKAELLLVGTLDGVNCVRRATQRDIEWVRSMGGDIPEQYTRQVNPMLHIRIRCPHGRRR